MHLARHASLVALAVVACGRDNSRTRPAAEVPLRPPAASIPAPPPTPGDLADAVRQLADPRQDRRDAAAAQVRAALAGGATLPGDHGLAHWRGILAALAPGVTTADFARRTGAVGEGGASSGQSATMTWRLDDAWTVVTYVDLPDVVREIAAPTRDVRASWVEPPTGHTGRWITYRATGVVAHDIDYVGGRYRRFAAYHANGQLSSEQRYVGGAIDGPEVGYHPDGSKAYEIAYAAGSPVGRWRHWYPSGAPRSDESYVLGLRDGRSTTWRADGSRSVMFDYQRGLEVGQAAWDEHGTLLYAHGSLEASPP